MYPFSHQTLIKQPVLTLGAVERNRGNCLCPLAEPSPREERDTGQFQYGCLGLEALRVSEEGRAAVEQSSGQPEAGEASGDDVAGGRG